jgi:hypothetical protein
VGSTFAAAVLAAAPTGVLGADDGAEDRARIAKSADELAKSGSAQFRGTTTTQSAENTRVSFDGRFAFARRAGEYSVDAAAIGLLGTGRVRALLVDGNMYFGLDALEGGVSADYEGKRWLRFDPTVLGGHGLGQTDPNGSIDALRGVTGTVEDLGTERVGGVRTEHYRVRINPARAIANAPDHVREEARNSIRPLGTKVIPTEVWIDSAGRLRKLRLRVGAGTLASPRGSVAFEFFDFGAPVGVETPPAHEVVDFADVLGGGSADSGT